MIAFALLLAPLISGGGKAMAMAVPDHHSEMTKSGHCGDQPVRLGGKASDKSCCVATCAPLAVAPAVPTDERHHASSVERPPLSRDHHSFLAKLPTPPPRAG